MMKSFYESNFWSKNTFESIRMCVVGQWISNQSRYCIVDLDEQTDSSQIVTGYKTLSEATTNMLRKVHQKPYKYRIYHLSLWKISKWGKVKKVCFSEDTVTHEEILEKLPKDVADAIFRGFTKLMEYRLGYAMATVEMDD